MAKRSVQGRITEETDRGLLTMFLPGNAMRSGERMLLVVGCTALAFYFAYKLSVGGFFPGGASLAMQGVVGTLKVLIILIIGGAPWAHIAISRRNQQLFLDDRHFRVAGLGILRTETRWVDRHKILRVQKIIPESDGRRSGRPFLRVSTRDTNLDFGRGLTKREVNWLVDDLRGRFGLHSDQTRV